MLKSNFTAQRILQRSLTFYNFQKKVLASAGWDFKKTLTGYQLDLMILLLILSHPKNRLKAYNDPFAQIGFEMFHPIPYKINNFFPYITQYKYKKLLNHFKGHSYWYSLLRVFLQNYIKLKMDFPEKGKYKKLNTLLNKYSIGELHILKISGNLKYFESSINKKLGQVWQIKLDNLLNIEFQNTFIETQPHRLRISRLTKAIIMEYFLHTGLGKEVLSPPIFVCPNTKKVKKSFTGAVFRYGIDYAVFLNCLKYIFTFNATSLKTHTRWAI